MNKISVIYVVFGLFFFSTGLYAQTDTILVNKVSEIEFSGFFSAYSSLFDRNNNPYVYSACSELGLVITDVTNINNPVIIDTVKTIDLGNSKVTNIYQDGNYLYVSIGGFAGASQSPGLAIFDVSIPSSLILLDIWKPDTLTQGSAKVVIDGDYAYLGIMEDGIAVLDISDKNNIQILSTYQPDPTWPGAVSYAPNGRGMDIRNDTIFLAYDAGGLRIIDVSDKYNPVQVAQYINTNITSVAAPAYNNVKVKGDYAFVTVDYCGLDVIDISDVNNIQTVNWYNPWNCIGASWFGSIGHANELILTNNDSVLFMTGGDSEILVLDVSSPLTVEKIGEYVIAPDSTIMWGIDVYQNKIVGSFVDNSGIPPILQPYYGDFGGLQFFEYDEQLIGIEELEIDDSFTVYPNPTKGNITLQYKGGKIKSVRIINSLGEQIQSFFTTSNSINISTQALSKGIYFVQIITSKNEALTRKVMVD